MIKKLTVIAAICLALTLATAACGCNAKQVAKNVRQVTKKTYYDTQTESTVKVGDIDVSYEVGGSQKIDAPKYKDTLKSLQDVDVPAKTVLAALWARS